MIKFNLKTLLVGGFIVLGMSVSAQDVETTTDNTTETAQTDGKKAKKEKKPSKFGNFMRRLGESATGINMSNELFVAMSLEMQQRIEIGLESCTGNPETGEVIAIFTYKAKSGDGWFRLGTDKRTLTAADAKGNAYVGKSINTYDTETNFQGNMHLTQGVVARQAFAFVLPKEWTSIEVVKAEFYCNVGGGSIASSMSDVEPIQIRNIPITWNNQE